MLEYRLRMNIKTLNEHSLKKGPSYVRWAAKMAVDLQTGVPWVMCKQTDAPDPVVSFASQLRLLLVLRN